MIKNRNTAVLSSKYQSDDDMKDFMVKTCGLKLIPVARTDNAFWISGDKRGNYIDGPKYYKIVFGHVTQVLGYNPYREKEGYGFDIQATGDLNAWSLIGEYRKMIHEAVEFVKESKEALNNTTLENA
jgi:hypothetical protein